MVRHCQTKLASVFSLNARKIPPYLIELVFLCHSPCRKYRGRYYFRYVKYLLICVKMGYGQFPLPQFVAVVSVCEGPC